MMEVYGQTPDVVAARRKAVKDEFELHEYTCLDAGKMTPGTLCINILHDIITTSVYHD